MEFGIEKWAMLVMKSGKWHRTEDKIRTLGENETDKYLGILEADTEKCKWKAKFKKNISGELENYLRQNTPAET